jgi:lipopolysaccharide assembly outer membrane protein LptD (OstA)
MTKCSIFLYALLILLTVNLHAQQTPPRPSQSSDTIRRIDILHADRFVFRTLDSAVQLQILAGHVQVRQGNSYFNADSITYNEKTRQIEAFGNVHIRDADSINIYSQYLLYEGQKKIAYFKDKVTLNDGSSVLHTNDMEYDMNGKIGTYRNGGRIESKQTTLTSDAGYYYADIKDVYFIGDVKMSDPEMALAADSLLYNTQSRVSTFISPTTIKSGKSVIQTREGFYDLNVKKAKFGGRTRLQDSSSVLMANDVAFDDVTGSGEARGDVRFTDTVENILLFSNRVFFNKGKKNFLATEKPVLVVVQNNDSVFIASDTIFSGQLKDLRGDSATLRKTAGKDSLRFFSAFNHVRIFNDSLQAVCDSLFYSDIDSVFEMYVDPVAWSRNSQIAGDTIFIETEKKKAKRLRVMENATMIQEVEPAADFYNQIKGRQIIGHLKDGDLERIETNGSAESIYYIKNDSAAYVGMNRSEAAAIHIYFDSSALKKIKLIEAVKGTTFPVMQIPEDQKKFKNFKWSESRRPKNKWELFL